MLMTELVKEVIDNTFEEVSASSLILKLLDAYSKLYLNGNAPGTCGKCHRDFYIKLKQNGMELAKKYDEAKKRTCQPAWNGLKYIPGTARHWDSELLTDKEAEYLLINDFLTEKDFKELPESYREPIKKVQDIKKPKAPKGRKIKGY
jgi:hypothetical protein